MTSKKVILIILDGWGVAPDGPGNAISLAQKPNFDKYWSDYPHVLLSASAAAVGLPEGQMGNSEVGHMAIGSGRVVWQDLPRISRAIEEGSFFKNQALTKCFEKASQTGRIHFIGLTSPGGVHSHTEHLYALLEMAKQYNIDNAFVHAITDGRDVDPKSADGFLEALAERMNSLGVGKLATVIGRYYAMDRDKRWERTKLAYDSLCTTPDEEVSDWRNALSMQYDQGITDEFFKPVVLSAQGRIMEGDCVVFFNFRSDRPRQLVAALVDKGFNSFERSDYRKDLYLVTMTEYDREIPVSDVAFPVQEVKNTLAEVISKSGLTQYHTAETEKYPHVTFFFNGGEEKPFEGEVRKVIASPKVATYDLQPSMSALGITENLLPEIGKYDFIVVNFANADMVGHTGVIRAAVDAIETVDAQLGVIVPRALSNGYEIIITADHGNAEKMLEEDGTVCTSHTTNPVPFILISHNHEANLSQGGLSNIAPTILEILGLDKPSEMANDTLVEGGSLV